MKKKVLTFLFPMILFSSNSASSCDFDIDWNLLQTNLNKVLTDEDYPPVTEISPTETDSQLQTSQPPQLIAEYFEKLNSAAFGRADVMSLVFGPHNIGPRCDSHSKKIFFSEEHLSRTQEKFPSDSQMVTKFKLAHEIGHFVQDHYLRTHNQAKTLSGLTGFFPDSNRPPHPIVDWRRASLPQNMVTSRERAYDYECDIGPAKKHAEVDAIGIILMKKLGYSDQQIAQGFRGLEDNIRSRRLYNLELSEVNDLAMIDELVEDKVRMQVFQQFKSQIYKRGPRDIVNKEI